VVQLIAVSQPAEVPVLLTEAGPQHEALEPLIEAVQPAIEMPVR